MDEIVRARRLKLMQILIAIVGIAMLMQLLINLDNTETVTVTDTNDPVLFERVRNVKFLKDSRQKGAVVRELSSGNCFLIQKTDISGNRPTYISIPLSTCEIPDEDFDSFD